MDFSLVAPTSFELKTKVMVMGDLEASEVSLKYSQMGRGLLESAATLTSSPPMCNTSLQDALPASLVLPLAKVPADWQVAPMQDLVLRATILRPCHSLDLDVWEEAARRESAARWSEVQDVRGQRWDGR